MPHIHQIAEKGENFVIPSEARNFSWICAIKKRTDSSLRSESQNGAGAFSAACHV
jgi:hypothetical protein